MLFMHYNSFSGLPTDKQGFNIVGTSVLISERFYFLNGSLSFRCFVRTCYSNIYIYIYIHRYIESSGRNSKKSLF